MQKPSSQQLLLLIATLWVGSLWTVGYVVAPTLFATLDDRAMAGNIAGALFRVEAWLSLACAFTMIALVLLRSARAEPQRAVVLRLTGAMAVCTAIGYFGMEPAMAAVREAGYLANAASGQAEMTDNARTMFGVLHGIAAVIFFVQSLLGIALVLKLR